MGEELAITCRTGPRQPESKEAYDLPPEHFRCVEDENTFTDLVLTWQLQALRLNHCSCASTQASMVGLVGGWSRQAPLPTKTQQSPEHGPRALPAQPWCLPNGVWPKGVMA